MKDQPIQAEYQKPREPFYKQWGGYLCIALALVVSSQLHRLPTTTSSPSNADQLKGLAGTKPLDTHLPEEDRKVAVVMRAIIADIRADRKAHDGRVAALDSEIKEICSAQSFSSRERIEHTLAVLKQMHVLAAGSVSMINQVPEVVNRHLASSDLSDSQKQRILKELSGLSNSEMTKAQKQAITFQQNWANATIDLYKYASQHVTEIEIVGGEIQIRNGRTREQFNARFERAQKLAADFELAYRNVETAKAEWLKEMGVTAADLGFDQ